ncbi:MAG: GTP-binding protein [Halieaceae bacterium]|nr:GTP-binding protein [Halieaceae bacterium]
MAQPIPTNIITGFLGVGKTTAIQHLLAQKPADERWAILVNEFGEVGIDGSLMAGSNTESQGVFIREVPGGCMCCTAGLPMQIALNMLLARARPHRLLIEPTGLGHPREVLASLAARHYRELIDLRATVTLVDARQVRRGDLLDHHTFNEQLAVSDVIVASKSDLYGPDDLPALLNFLGTSEVLKYKAVYPVEQGALELAWLAPATRQDIDSFPPAPAAPDNADADTSDPEIPDQGYLCMANQGEGFHSRGWIFSNDWVFDQQKLHAVLNGIDADRAKGVFITDRGVAAFNKSGDVLTQVELDDCMDSRVECIGRNEQALSGLEDALLDCVISR